VIGETDDLDIKAGILKFNFVVDQIVRGDANGNGAQLTSRLVELAIEMTKLLAWKFPSLNGRPDGGMADIHLWLDGTRIQAPDEEEFEPALRLKIEQLNFYLQELANTESATNTAPTAPPILWQGSDTDLVALFVALERKKWLKGSSRYALLNTVKDHFRGRENKILKSENLKQLAERSSIFDSLPDNPST
jgi:hypothetical protein